MMLGFGITEQNVEEAIKKLVVTALAAGSDVYAISEKWNAENDYSSKSDPLPERFTTFHIYDGAVHFMHTNTRHPFSPDGWVGMQTEWIYDEDKYHQAQEAE